MGTPEYRYYFCYHRSSQDNERDDASRIMSLSGTNLAAIADSIAGDRRLDRRYEISLELRWKLIRRKRVLDTGIGTTLDVSSGGVFFETDHPLPGHGDVEISISWPVLLHNVAPLQLVVTGRVVRISGRRAAIRRLQHEFRTARTVMEPARAEARSGGPHRRTTQ